MRASVRITAVLLLLAASFGGLEVALRLYQSVAHGVPFTSWFPQVRERRFQLSPFLVFGPRMDYQIEGRRLPEQSYFDSAGFRTNEPVGTKPPGEFRILAVGGSTTENLWNEEGLHWPLTLECSLRAAGYPQVRVLNAAMSAYTTAHTIVRLDFDLMDYEPDLVVAMHNVNDLQVTYSAARAGRPVDGHYAVRYTTRGFTGEISEEDARISRVWHSIASRLEGSPPRPGTMPEYDLEPGRAIFARNLRTMARAATSRGAGMVLLTMPYHPGRHTDHYTAPSEAGMTDLPDADRFVADMDAFNRTILEVASEMEGVRAVDMASLVPADDGTFVDLVHYSAAGVADFGDALARVLVGSIPSPEGEVSLSEAAIERCAWRG